jgi:hypothetical protein
VILQCRSLAERLGRPGRRRREKFVRFTEADDINEEVDAAYRTKCRRYDASIIDHITSLHARRDDEALAARLSLDPSRPLDRRVAGAPALASSVPASSRGYFRALR